MRASVLASTAALRGPALGGRARSPDEVLMSGIPEPRAQPEPWARRSLSGWEAYRRAIDLLDRDEWAPALRLLAVAETEFRTADDREGLWRALSGQAVSHWGAGDSSLAVARATAALLAAEAADDAEGAGLTTWQLAVMLLSQGDYKRSAELLLRSELALGRAGAAALAAEVGAAARLCVEILRWQGMVAQGVVERRTAAEVMLAIHRDLTARLAQAAVALRSPAGAAAGGAWLAHAVLLPQAGGGERESQRASLATRLARWWRGLTEGEPAGVRLPPLAAPAPRPTAAPRLSAPEPPQPGEIVAPPPAAPEPVAPEAPAATARPAPPERPG
ncbi:MAG TPA: hypothetical protein PKD53_34485, partial [Chloroflexaceae bacterium]|nr:hypothetical protein [Chloroflexaceae bacterium]